MNSSICPRDFPLSYTKGQYKASTSNDVATAIIIVVNLITSPVAVVLNSLILTAVLKRPALRSMKNISIIFLTFSDFLVCAVAQTSFIANEVNILTKGRVICTEIIAVYLYTELLCLGLSFLTIKVMSLERFTAIFAPYWFYKHVTKARVAIIYATFWLVWTVCITSVIFIFKIPDSTSTIILSAFMLINLFFSITVFFKIHKLQKTTPVQPNHYPHSTSRALVRSKATRTVFYVNTASFLSYFPFAIVVLIHTCGMVKDNVLIYHVLYPLSRTALFNSALVNPIIYLWRCSEIRASVRKLFKEHSTGVAAFNDAMELNVLTRLNTL